MVCDIRPYQDASTHQIWLPITNNIRDIFAPDTIILKNYVRSEGHSDTKMVCDTPLSPDTFTHTKIGNPISKNIKDMRRTQCGPDSKN